VGYMPHLKVCFENRASLYFLVLSSLHLRITYLYDGIIVTYRNQKFINSFTNKKTEVPARNKA
jgi:hypothetical protein